MDRNGRRQIVSKRTASMEQKSSDLEDSSFEVKDLFFYLLFYDIYVF